MFSAKKLFWKFRKIIRKNDLVYFTTQVPGTSDTTATQATRVRHKRHEYDRIETRATRVQHESTSALHKRHECDTSEKFWFWWRNKWKDIFTLLYQRCGKWKIARKRTISLKELSFGNASFPCRNAFEKCTIKTELCNRESCMQKLYTRL